MSKKKSPTPRSRKSDDRRIIVRAEPRAEPDLRRLARALIELARNELEQEHQRADPGPQRESGDGPGAAA